MTERTRKVNSVDQVVPKGLDTSKPNIARVCDYWLGGKDNFAADRDLADMMRERNPRIPAMARANRQFITAVARRAAESGVAAFLDLGAGLPVRPYVHEAAQDVNPDAKVLYIDYDPMVVLHAQALLTGTGVVAAEADLRHPADVLALPETRELMSSAEPVCVILGLVLHFLAADQAAAVVAAYREHLPAGSWIAVSILHYEDTELMADMSSMYTAAQFINHGPAELASWLDGTELLSPGISETQQWTAGVSGPPPSSPGWIACAVGINRS
jgi:O-methyltransferase involved in polyketide biosynthesis